MGFFAIMSSTMSKNPVLKPYATSLGTPTDWTGIVAAASTIPGILVSLPAASLSDILGRKKMLIVAGVIFASAPFFYILIGVWWQLIMVRFYHGFATAIFVPVAEASVAELFPAKRGERISLFSSSTYVGRAIAPFLGAAILQVTNNGFHVLYLAVGVAGVTALVMALPYLVERKKLSAYVEEAKPKQTVRRMFDGWVTMARDHGVLVVSFVQACQFYTFGAVEYFLVGYLTEVVKLDIVLTGIITGSLVVMPIIAKPYMGRISDRVGRRIPIATGCIVSGLALLGVPFVSGFPVLLVLAIVYGFGFASVTASTPALISELVPETLIGTSMGFLDMIMDVGQTLGPIVSGFILATSLQYTGVFPSLTVLLLFSCVVFALSSLGKAGLDEHA